MTRLLECRPASAAVILIGLGLFVSSIHILAQGEIRMPLAPVAPTRMEQCDLLHTQFGAFADRVWKLGWDACIVPVGKQPASNCRALRAQHAQILEVWLPTVQACRDSVNAHLKREEAERRDQAEQERAAKEAEQQRQDRVKQMQREYEQMQNSYADQQRRRVEDSHRFVEEERRVAAEAEQQRREASQAAINDAMRELGDARRRTGEYAAKASAVAGRRVDLTAVDERALDTLKQQADADALRPRYVPVQPSGPAVATDLSGVRDAVLDIVRAEYQAILKWGLNQTETGAMAVEAWEMTDEFAGRYAELQRSASYVRGAMAGTTTREEDWEMLKHIEQMAAGRALPGSPIAIQVIDSVGGGMLTGMQQLDTLFTLDRNASAQEILNAVDNRALNDSYYRPFIPIDRARQFERLYLESQRAVDGYNRGFLTIFGR